MKESIFVIVCFNKIIYKPQCADNAFATSLKIHSFHSYSLNSFLLKSSILHQQQIHDSICQCLTQQAQQGQEDLTKQRRATARQCFPNP